MFFEKTAECGNHPWDGERIFANHPYDKGLISKQYKELKNNSKKKCKNGDPLCHFCNRSMNLKLFEISTFSKKIESRIALNRNKGNDLLIHAAQRDLSKEARQKGHRLYDCVCVKFQKAKAHSQ